MKTKESQPSRKVVTRSTFVQDKGRVTTAKSMTVQGDAVSLKRLLARNDNGEPLSGRDGQYTEDTDHDEIDREKFRGLDLTEQDDEHARLHAKIAQLNAEYDREQAELKARNQPEIERAEYDPAEQFVPSQHNSNKGTIVNPGKPGYKGPKDGPEPINERERYYRGSDEPDGSNRPERGHRLSAPDRRRHTGSQNDHDKPNRLWE